MKFVKGVSLFFIYPMIMFGIGFYAGVECMHFFYPGTNPVQEAEELPREDWPEQIVDRLDSETKQGEEKSGENSYDTSWQSGNGLTYRNESGSLGASAVQQDLEDGQEQPVDVAASGETLSVDTKYVMEETDIINRSVVETISKLPGKYVGQNREQFLESMAEYEMNPPLSELERGFVSLEVLAFSRERVVVQMNYQYVQPSNSFYLAVCDNEVVVYLEDKETIYINTGIQLENLPADVQLEIIQMLWMADEETLYHFLENYSS